MAFRSRVLVMRFQRLFLPARANITVKLVGKFPISSTKAECEWVSESLVGDDDGRERERESVCVCDTGIDQVHYPGSPKFHSP